MMGVLVAPNIMKANKKSAPLFGMLPLPQRIDALARSWEGCVKSALSFGQLLSAQRLQMCVEELRMIIGPSDAKEPNEQKEIRKLQRRIKVLEKCIQNAADEAFQRDVIDPEMKEHIIPDEYADEQDWKDSKIAEWKTTK